MSGYSIPYGSEGAIKNTVIGYYRASSSGGEASAEKAAEGAGISEDSLRRQRSFLAEIGILRGGESGYALTDVGQDIGRALLHERDDEAKGPFHDLLWEWEATSSIMDDLGADYVSEDDVMDSISFITDHELNNPRQKAGANGLIDLYLWTGVLEQNADGDYRVAEIEPGDSGPEPPESPGGLDEEEPKEPAGEQPPQNLPTAGSSPPARQNPPSATGTQFDISLELTGDEDPKNVKKLVIAVRKGLEREIEDGDDESETRSDGGKRPKSQEDSSLDSFLDD